MLLWELSILECGEWKIEPPNTHTHTYFIFNRYMNKFAFHYQNCLSLNNDVADLIPFHEATRMFPSAHIDIFWMEIVMEIYRIYTFDTRQRIYLYGNANVSVPNVFQGVFISHLLSPLVTSSLCEQKGIINLFFNFTWNGNIYKSQHIHWWMLLCYCATQIIIILFNWFSLLRCVFVSTFRSIPLSIILQFKERKKTSVTMLILSTLKP